jgi:hypothetical protein
MDKSSSAIQSNPAEAITSSLRANQNDYQKLKINVQ